MKTAGIDLATKDKNTAVCVVDWFDPRICVDLRDDASDDGLIRICREVDKVGIDCPFGWPAPFVPAISAHALGHDWPSRGRPDHAVFMNTLAFRLTDLRSRRSLSAQYPWP